MKKKRCTLEEGGEGGGEIFDVNFVVFREMEKK